MPQRINVPGHGIVEFPDGMSDADIVKAISANTPSAAPASAPFEDPGFAKTLVIGTGRTLDRVGKGVQQAYYSAKQPFDTKDVRSLVDGKTDSQRKLDQLAAQVKADDEAYAPLREARPWATGIGEAAPSLVLPGGGATTLLGNAGRMALSGAIPGALEYGSAGERAARAGVGAATGAAIPVLGMGLKTAKSFAEPLWQGGREKIAGRVLNTVAGDAAPQVIQRMRNAAPVVAGSMPTAAQVAESGGIAAMERAAAQANPEAYTQRAMEQASARMSALRGIAGDDASMAAALAAREGQSGPLFQQATKAVYQVDDKLANLLERPDMKDALKQAERLAANDGRTFQFSTTSSAPFKGVGGAQPVVSRQITGQGLQDLKMAIDGMLSDPASGFAGSAGRSLKNQRGQVLDWMEGVNPVFKQARTTHAELSKPINQMEVGQYLMDKVSPALSDFGALGQESGAQYARSLRNADQTVRAATQFKGNKTLADVMTPEQMATLTGVGTDLARKANAQNLGRGVGSDTFQKLAMNNIAQQSGMPRLMGGLLEMPGVSRATRWLYSDSDKQMQGLLADTLLNPQQAAMLMDEASKKALLSNSPKARQALEQVMLRGGLLSGPSLSSSIGP
jgi:hypothetical protein